MLFTFAMDSFITIIKKNPETFEASEEFFRLFCLLSITTLFATMFFLDLKDAYHGIYRSSCKSKFDIGLIFVVVFSFTAYCIYNMFLLRQKLEVLKIEINIRWFFLGVFVVIFAWVLWMNLMMTFIINPHLKLSKTLIFWLLLILLFTFAVLMFCMIVYIPSNQLEKYINPAIILFLFGIIIAISALITWIYYVFIPTFVKYWNLTMDKIM